MEIDTPPEEQIPDSPLEAVPPKRRPVKTILIVAGAIFISLILCCGILTLPSLRGVRDQDEIIGVIDTFMEAMADQDVERAYALNAEVVQEQLPISKLEELVEGSNYVLFDGYQSIEVTQFNPRNSVNTNPNAPKGLNAKVSGKVNYSGGYTGTFNATVILEENEWKLYGINVIAPPDKFEDYLKSNS